MQDLTVSPIQTALHWQDAAANRKMFEAKMPDKSETDLIILPEMFTTGFSMDAKNLAEKQNGESVHWLQQHATRLQAAIMGSLIIEDQGQYFNRMIIAKPNGDIEHYNKRHLFRMAGEDQHYTAGTEKQIVNIKGWNICPQICYDLRFPVWSRNQNDYDLLIYVANWPAPRKNAWSALLVARAIENNAYVIGVNRTGQDEKGHSYNGDSAVIDTLGQTLWQAEQAETTSTVTLSAEDLLANRKKFPWHLDADSYQLKP